jgi:hypothetical protein
MFRVTLSFLVHGQCLTGDPTCTYISELTGMESAGNISYYPGVYNQPFASGLYMCASRVSCMCWWWWWWWWWWRGLAMEAAVRPGSQRNDPQGLPEGQPTGPCAASFSLCHMPWPPLWRPLMSQHDVAGAGYGLTPSLVERFVHRFLALRFALPGTHGIAKDGAKCSVKKDCGDVRPAPP